MAFLRAMLCIGLLHQLTSRTLYAHFVCSAPNTTRFVQMISGIYVYKNNGYNGQHVYYARACRYSVAAKLFCQAVGIYRETEQIKKIIYEHNNNQNTREEINMCDRVRDDTSQLPICRYIYIYIRTS